MDGRSIAAAAGRWAGRLVHRVSPARVDPEAWSRAVVVFQQQSGELLRSRSRSAGPVLAALLLLEGLVLVLCLRFVGVPAERASVAVVLVAFLVSFPLTTLPFNGLGALDAAIVGILTAEGVTDTSAEVAALVVWRVCLLLLPLLLGLVSLLLWRRHRAAGPTT